jgi:histidine triad (HIT) family protein
LVIPKVEVDYLFDLDDALLSDMMRFAKCVAKAVDQATGCLRTGILVQGLEVPHAHIHLVPLYSEHTKLAFGSPVSVSSEEMASIAAAISSRIRL